MKILSIIVTYNGGSWIDRCVQSLSNSTVETDVIIIDNASQDDTIDLVKNKFPVVQCIRLTTNKGFGAANNVGFKIALTKKYDFVFLVNQDARVAADCIERLLAVASSNKQLGIVSPFHWSYDGSAEERYFKEFVLSQYSIGYMEDKYKGAIKEWYYASFVNAAAWLLPIATVKKVGGFDPLFFYTGEDNDYIQRLRYYGLKIGFVPAASFYHQGSNAGLLDIEENAILFCNQELLKYKNPIGTTLGLLKLYAFNYKKYVFANQQGVSSTMKKDVYKKLATQLKQILKSRKEQKSRNAFL